VLAKDGQQKDDAMIETMAEAELANCALAYVSALYRELSQENGAPNLGTQNQAVDFILADPELRAAVARWAGGAEIDEEGMAPPRRLPRDAAYERIRAYIRKTMTRPAFPPGNEPA
jgi:hypothetical protein